MSQKVVERLKKQLGDAVLETHDQFGDDTVVVPPDRWREAALFVRDDRDCAMDHFIDLTAVDHAERRRPRFDVVLHVRSIDKMHRIRLKTRVDFGADGENPRVDSLVPVWRGANWFERECYDLFGIEFVDHPDLRRILMYDEFVGHPLRKDYPANTPQPLIPYREDAPGKLPPFDRTEGLPFGRQAHVDWARVPRENELGFEEDS